MLDALRMWSPRRWWAAGLAGVLTGLVIALPTAMLPNPVFGREIPTTWWAWPTLAATAVLGGLLVASYVREPGSAPSERLNRRGGLGGLLSFFAVGCPVCNKLALVALGYTGALQWFAPIQPVLGILGVGLLAWALRDRLRGQLACALPAPTEAGPDGATAPSPSEPSRV
jgi:hypothetical protein